MREREKQRWDFHQLNLASHKQGFERGQKCYREPGGGKKSSKNLHRAEEGDMSSTQAHPVKKDSHSKHHCEIFDQHG